MQNKVFIKSCRFDKIIADSNKKFPIDFTDFFMINKSQKYFLYCFWLWTYLNLDWFIYLVSALYYRDSFWSPLKTYNTYRFIGFCSTRT